MNVLSSEEARVMAVGKPLSYLHVAKAEIDLDPAIDVHSEAVYTQARDNLPEIHQGGHPHPGSPTLLLRLPAKDGRPCAGGSGGRCQCR